MPLFCYINTMLVNRILRESRYIFTNNIDIYYLKLLSDLGSFPIITGIKKDNIRHFKIIREIDFKELENHIFNYEICSISDIKKILYTLKYVKNINTLVQFPYILELHLNYNYAN